MTAAAQHQPPAPLRFARHIVGMAILAAANPLIYYSDGKLATWASTWVMPLVIAAAVFALYALLFTKRAKAAWPKSFFMLAWVLLGLMVAGPYMEVFGQKRTTEQVVAPSQASTPASMKQQSPAKPATLTYEEAYGLPPARN